MDRIISIIEKHLAQPYPLKPDTALLSSGLVDSFSMAALLTELEENYKVRLEPMAIGVDNFDTPAQIRHYVETRLRGLSKRGSA